MKSNRFGLAKIICLALGIAASATPLVAFAAGQDESISQDRRDWFTNYQISLNALRGGDFAQAQKNIEQALTIYATDWSQKPDNTAIMLMKVEADILLQSGEIRQGLNLYERALGYLEGQHNNSLSALGEYLSLAQIYYRHMLTKQMFQRAQQLAEKALQMSVSVGDRALALRLNILILLSDIHSYAGSEMAEFYLQQAADLGAKMLDPNGDQMVLIMLKQARRIKDSSVQEQAYSDILKRIRLKKVSSIIEDAYHRDRSYQELMKQDRALSEVFAGRVNVPPVRQLIEAMQSHTPPENCDPRQNFLIAEITVEEGRIKDHQFITGAEYNVSYALKALEKVRQTLKPYMNGVNRVRIACLEDARALSLMPAVNQDLSNTEDAQNRLVLPVPEWPDYFLQDRQRLLTILAETDNQTIQSILNNYQLAHQGDDYLAALRLMDDVQYLDNGIMDGFLVNEWDMANLYALYYDIATQYGFTGRALEGLERMLGSIQRAQPDEAVELVMVRHALALMPNAREMPNNRFIEHLSQMSLGEGIYQAVLAETPSVASAMDDTVSFYISGDAKAVFYQ